MKILKKLFNKNRNISLLFLTFLTLTSLNILQMINVYDVMYVVFFICIFLTYKNTNYKALDKKYSKYSFILSCILSLLFILGFLSIKYISIQDGRILKSFLSIKYFCSFIFIIPLFYYLLYYLFIINIKVIGRKQQVNNKTLFLSCFIFISLIYLVYYLTLYPGVLTPDSISQLDIIIGTNPLSDHHPLVATKLLSIPIKIGYMLFKNYNDAVGLFSLIQMFIMSSGFSLFIVYLNKKKVSLWILIVILLFYSLSPIFGYYSVTMWKDVLFGLIFLWFTVSVYELYIKRNSKILKKDIILFIIMSLLLAFFRNNGIYMFFIMIPFMIVTFKKQYKIIIYSIASILLVFFIIKGPVYKYFNVIKSESIEYIGMPLQQIGRIVWAGGNIDKESKENLNSVMGINSIYYSYNPFVSDGIKFSPDFNVSEFNNNKFKYFKTWLKLIIKNPDIAVDAYLCSTLGYWYPNKEYWVIANGVFNNKYNIKRDAKLPKEFNYLIYNLSLTNIPIISLERSIGLLFWICLIFAFLYGLRKGKSILFCFTPVLGLWLTMMLASPVNGEFRYIFGVLCALPFIMLVGKLER